MSCNFAISVPPPGLATPTGPAQSQVQASVGTEQAVETAGESAEDLHSARSAPAALREAADIVNRLVQQRQVRLGLWFDSQCVLLDAPARYVCTTPLALLLALTACDR